MVGVGHSWPPVVAPRPEKRLAWAREYGFIFKV